MSWARTSSSPDSHRAFSLLRRQLAIVTSVLLLSLAITAALVDAEFSQRAEQSAISDLQNRLSLVALWAETEHRRGGAHWDQLARTLAKRTQARVSFIGADGKLRGDSALASVDLDGAESQRTRLEVDRALSGRREVAVRRDESGILTRYVAEPVRLEDGSLIVARLAARVTEKEQIAQLREKLLITIVVSGLAALTLAWLFLRRLLRPVRRLTELASQMGEGDISVRAPSFGIDEYDELSAALDQLNQGHARAVGALQQERDRMHGILSSMDEGVLFLDEERRIALINPKLREMLLLHGDVVQRTVLEAIRHADLDELIDEALDDEEGGGPAQGEIQVAGLLPKQLLVRAQRLEGPEAGLVAIFVDVTENRRLENLRREFVANVSHELRTPVTSVCSATETLGALLGEQDEPKRRFLDIIARNALRMKSLVEDLLDLSRIESKQFRLALEAVELGSIVEPVFRLHGESASRRSVELISTVPSDFPSVRVDRKALEHVLSNLVDNAVKYAGEGKTVRLSARADLKHAFVTVSDDGPGIEERHLPRIFERFYRVDAGRSRAVGGTGLGLSIVKNLVESMAGSVSVESTLGVGTSFVVKIPLGGGSESKPPQASH